MEKKEKVASKPKKENKSVEMKERKCSLLIPLLVLFFLSLTVAGVVFFTDLEDRLVTSLFNNVVTYENTFVVMEEDTLVNEGWSLYSIPEYGFSMEIANTYEEDDNENPTGYWYWVISHKSYDESEQATYDGVTMIDEYHFYYTPINRPESVQDIDPDSIRVMVYDYEEEVDLEDLKSDIQNDYDEEGPTILLSTEIEERWGKDVLKTRTEFEGVHLSYRFLDDGKMYLVSIFESSEFDDPTSDYSKMIESIKFE
jgi:hypothetical protein